MSSHPYMPLYVGSYLKHTRRLTTEQHGAYLLLLMELWTQGGYIDADPAALRKITGTSPKRWPQVWNAILAFFDIRQGLLCHERILFELQKADQISIKRRNAGAKGNIVKALKANGAYDAIASAVGTQMRTQTGTQTRSDQKDNTGGAVERGRAAPNPAADFPSAFAEPLSATSEPVGKPQLTVVKNTNH